MDKTTFDADGHRFAVSVSRDDPSIRVWVDGAPAISLAGRHLRGPSARVAYSTRWLEEALCGFSLSQTALRKLARALSSSAGVVAGVTVFDQSTDYMGRVRDSLLGVEGLRFVTSDRREVSGPDLIRHALCPLHAVLAAATDASPDMLLGDDHSAGRRIVVGGSARDTACLDDVYRYLRSTYPIVVDQPVGTETVLEPAYWVDVAVQAVAGPARNGIRLSGTAELLDALSTEDDVAACIANLGAFSPIQDRKRLHQDLLCNLATARHIQELAEYAEDLLRNTPSLWRDTSAVLRVFDAVADAVDAATEMLGGDLPREHPCAEMLRRMLPLVDMTLGLRVQGGLLAPDEAPAGYQAVEFVEGTALAASAIEAEGEFSPPSLSADLLHVRMRASGVHLHDIPETVMHARCAYQGILQVARLRPDLMRSFIPLEYLPGSTDDIAPPMEAPAP